MVTKVKPKTILNLFGSKGVDEMPLVSIDELTTPFTKVDDTKTKPSDNFLDNLVISFFDNNPDLITNQKRGVLATEFIKKFDPNIKTRKGTEINTNTVNRIIGKIYGKLDKHQIHGNKQAENLIAKLLSDNPNIKSSEIRTNLTNLDSKFKTIPTETITKYLNRNHPGQRQFKTTEEVRVKEKERHEAQKDWDDVEGSKPIVNLQAKVKPILDQYLAEGQTLSGAHPAQIKNRLNEEAKTFITTKARNNRHVVLENQIKNLMNKKNKLLENFDYKNKENMAQYNIIENDINKITNEMGSLGLESKLWNDKTNRFEYFGELYGNNPEKKSPILSLKESIVDPNVGGGPGRNDGGLVRPNMALGGDMAQFTEMESVVPDLNPDEAEVQLAMSFKNPFKLKKTPPLIDDVDTTLKIADQGPGTSKTAAKTHTLDAGVGSDSIFYLKSDLELANAVQDKMTPQQWLGYLTKKGVSPTELDEFGLQNLLYRVGGWDESTKKWKNNKAISKSDLIAAYKNEKPVITYKINQVEPFEKGVKDFVSFLTKRKSGGSYYHGEKGMDDVRGLLNKPQDIGGDTLRLRLSEVLSKGGDIKKDWPMYEKGIIADINKTFKQFYGIDDVIKNGIPEGMNIPFYSKNLLDRFNRLRKGEGFYFQKGKGVAHEGTQFMPGGTGYIEIPFTYNPNPNSTRANEPKFTFGEGHFTNPEGNNPVFWMRASERTDEQGNRILFIEEIQSDMHQKVKQKPDTFSYAPRFDQPGIANYQGRFQDLKKELTKVSDQIDKITGHTDPSATTVMERLKVKRDSIRAEMDRLTKQYEGASGKQADEVFPEGPFKKSENQSKIALKTAINLAQKEGFDGVAMVTGKAKNKFANASGETAKGNIGFYDQIAVKAMKNTAKNLDLDFSATNIKDGHGNTWAKIPVINLKETTINKSVDMYKAEGGYIHRPSFVDVVPTL